MNQEKIGKFIAKKRKEKNLTQFELAEKIGVTDKSISNWETGKNMPDLSLFKPLCDILNISINELMSGEEITKEHYQEKFEENVLNTINYVSKQNDKKENIINIGLLLIGVLFTIISLIFFDRGEVQDISTVIGMMVAIFGLNRLSSKFSYVKRLIILLIAASCIISLITLLS